MACVNEGAKFKISINIYFTVQYVVIPPRRSTAEAFQILVSHMFGDAGSPYLIGVVSFWSYIKK